MHVERHRVSVTTDASGNATAYTPPIVGEIRQIVYTKVDFADGVDITITSEDTQEQLWVESNVNASKRVMPVAQVNKTDGTLAASADTSPVLARLAIGRDRVKIVIAQGGNTKQGIFDVIIG